VIGPYAVAPAATYAIAHALWQGALVALVAALAFAALRRRSPALRHAVGLGFIAAAALLPIVTFVLYRRAHPPVQPVVDALGPVLIRGTGWLALAVPSIWLVGALALLVRQLGGWRQIMTLGRERAALPDAWRARVDVLRDALGISRPVELRAGLGGTPFTARAVRPVVWLPAPLWARLPVEQRDALLAHELAHVRRLDWIWNGAQCAIEAILWFHPAVWWLGRRVRQDREHACDDLAVAACGDAVALAEALSALERARSPELVLAARGGLLFERVSRLLAGTPAPTRVPLGLIALLALGLAGATRLALPHDMLVGLRVDASTRGPLTPGAYREITADAFRMQHRYRGHMDAQGRVHEIYEEDGVQRPIDPRVRAWLDELVAIDAR